MNRRRVLLVPELPLAIDAEAIASIADADTRAAWLPAWVFGDRVPSTPRRRALVLVDGARFEVPAAMQLLDSVEILELPALLADAAELAGVTGLAVLDDGLVLVCDPRRIAQGGR